ncbi:MAG: hypothetical protein RSA48_01360 [Bacilli bacterium]
MKTFIELGFTESQINEFLQDKDESFISLILNSQSLIRNNILFFKEQGFSNYLDLFLINPEFFCFDYSTIIKKIESYQKDELINYLKLNPEFLSRI